MVEIPKKSKAAVLEEYNRPLKIQEYPIPEVELGGILVRIEMAGICGTDVHQWRGELGLKAPLPNIPGHETVGRIVKLGGDSMRDCAGEELHIGDRMMWAHVSCGSCFWCTIAHQPTICPNRVLYGIRHSNAYPHLTGGFAEYEYIMPGTEMIKVPEELLNEEVIGVGCAFRTVVSAFERLRGVGTQESVVIQGSGPIGLYSTLLAAEGGAGKVIVVGAPKIRLELAKRWGADHIINIEEVPDPSQRLAEILKLTERRGPDVVVEASGGPTAFREGLEMVRRGGRYLVIGQGSLELTASIVPGMVALKHLEVIGNCSAEIGHYAKALQFIKGKRQKYSFADIVTKKYPLNQINDALAAMEAGREIKPVILP
jgi:D-arabinose 1-dehydrogenase-like Zn-dependent alcohol dehydrogenase